MTLDRVKILIVNHTDGRITDNDKSVKRHGAITIVPVGGFLTVDDGEKEVARFEILEVIKGDS